VYVFQVLKVETYRQLGFGSLLTWIHRIVLWITSVEHILTPNLLVLHLQAFVTNLLYYIRI